MSKFSVVNLTESCFVLHSVEKLFSFVYPLEINNMSSKVVVHFGQFRSFMKFIRIYIAL